MFVVKNALLILLLFSTFFIHVTFLAPKYHPEEKSIASTNHQVEMANRAFSPKIATYNKKFYSRGTYSKTWSYISDTYDVRWQVFSGEQIKGVALANTSKWGLVHAYIGEDSVSLINVSMETINNVTSVSVEYVYTEVEPKPINDWFVGDVDGDGYDDILILTNSTIKFVGYDIQQEYTNIIFTKFAVGNLDSDEQLEIAALSTEPRLYIFDYYDGVFTEKNNTGLEEALSYSAVDLDIAETDTGGYIIAVFSSDSGSKIFKISGSGNIIYRLSILPSVEDFELFDSNSDSLEDSLFTLEYSSGEYIAKTYDVSGTSITQKAVLSNYSDVVHSISAFDLTDSFVGDELFVCHGTILSVYSSSGANITDINEVSSDIFNVGLKVINGTKFLIYTTTGEVVSMNSTLNERIDRITISSADVLWLATGNDLANISTLIAADSNQIGYELNMTADGRFTETTNYLVSGKVTFIGYVNDQNYFVVGGLFPYVYGISIDGKILWRYAVSDMLVKAKVTDTGLILLADYAGTLHILNASSGALINTLGFGAKIYALEVGDVDPLSDGEEIVVGWVQGTTSYVSVIIGVVSCTIYNYTYSSILSDLNFIQYDSDSQLEIIAVFAVVSNEIKVLDFDGNTFSTLFSSSIGSVVPSYVASGDYTGEGGADAVIMGIEGNSRTIVYALDATGILRVVANLSSIFQITHDLPSRPISMFDINNDTRDEVIFGVNNGQDTNITFMAIGSTGVEDIKYYPIEGSYNLRHVEYTDIDMSGAPDTICVMSDGGVYVFKDYFFGEAGKDIVTPEYTLVFSGEAMYSKAIDIDSDGYREFFIGGAFGGVLADKFHRLTLTILQPENASEVVYANVYPLDLVWDYVGDIEVESFSVLKNGSVLHSSLPPDNTSLSISIEDEGIWNITIRAKTIYESVYYDISFILVTDYTKPTVQFVSAPQQYTNSSLVSISWNMSDNLAGILKTVVYLNGSAREGNDTFFKFTANYSALYNFTLVVYDKAGNYEVLVKEIYVDLDPPMIWLVEPGEDEIFTNDLNAQITLKWNASDNFGLSSIKIFIDSELYTSLDPNSETFLISGLSEGQHTVYVVAVDYAGNKYNDSVRIIVDLTPPVIQLLSPENNSAFSESMISISFMVEDQLSGVKSVKILFDGVLIQTVYNKTVGAVPIDMSSLENPEGIHNVSIIVTDNAGNSITGITYFIYDVTPPTVYIESPKEGSTSIPEITISWYANDSLSGIAKVEIWIGDKLLLEQDYNGEEVVNGSKTVKLDIGSHKITIVVQDRAGNYESESVEIEINPSPTTNQMVLVVIVVVIVASAVASYIVFKKYLKNKLRRRPHIPR